HFFFSGRRRHTGSKRDWSSDVCSSDLWPVGALATAPGHALPARELVNLIRGCNAWPGAVAKAPTGQLTIWRAAAVDAPSGAPPEIGRAPRRGSLSTRQRARPRRGAMAG